ncbi:MAG: PEP-CTERM-box response regulator transcription factor [Deltaproteobacteria bacterium]|nr:PEP-CTERM-box response regulator transcription factor [Candidatus Anaeroferrophillacea bacterium]
MEPLLIVDDSDEIRRQLKWGLGKTYKIFQAASADQALMMFTEHRPPVVTLDLGLPPDADGSSEGLRCLRAILAADATVKVIVISGNEDHAVVLEAVGIGAYDYYHKPIDLEELRVILARAFHLAGIEAENRQLLADRTDSDRGMAGIYGQCPAMQEVFATIRKVATVDVPVLILGDSGTGKELVARALHDRGLRRDQPFIPINCGAIPENLLESELFGHEKGAFTGAHVRVQGKVEYAAGGTLFLDEIGEMPPSLQVKLLRFLQERVIQRVGGREDIAVDVRVVAATNVDIERAIAVDRFREDLYYRIGVVCISLPPLRDRGEDLFLLANIFLQRTGRELGKKIMGLSTAAVAAMQAYEWPGNVRELENKVKRAVIMAETPMVEPEDLGLKGRERPVVEDQAAVLPPRSDLLLGPALEGLTMREARALVERRLLERALVRVEGNVVQAAADLGVSRPTFYDLLKKHNLDLGLKQK